MHEDAGPGIPIAWNPAFHGQARSDSQVWQMFGWGKPADAPVLPKPLCEITKIRCDALETVTVAGRRRTEAQPREWARGRLGSRLQRLPKAPALPLVPAVRLARAVPLEQLLGVAAGVSRLGVHHLDTLTLIRSRLLRHALIVPSQLGIVAYKTPVASHKSVAKLAASFLRLISFLPLEDHFGELGRPTRTGRRMRRARTPGSP